MKKIFFIISCILLSTALLVALLPRQQKSTFDYEVGQPWKYAPLIASFDFPIYKSEEHIRAASDSAMRAFQPFFDRSEEVGLNQAEALRRDAASGKFARVPASYIAHAASLLDEVYEAGILTPEQYNALRSDSVKRVRIVSEQQATSVGFDELRSTRSAYEYMMTADTLNYRRDVMTLLDLNHYLTANLTADEAKTATARKELMRDVSTTDGMVLTGQRIIDRGDIVTPSHKQILDSFLREDASQQSTGTHRWRQIAGQALFILLAMCIFPLYLRMFRRDYMDSIHKLLLIFVGIVAFPVLTYLMVRYNYFSVYVVPYAMVPLFVRIFFDSRTATMTLILQLVLCSFGLRIPYEFVVVELFMGLIAIYSIKELTERAQILRIAVLTAFGGIVVQMAYDLSQGIDLTTADLSRYSYLTLSGFLLLFAYPLMYLIERVFGFTSSVTLVELTNINNPLIRKLSKVAQGTFNHSMQVGNLAAEVADKIGGRPQLARTAALYHDIGKMLNPAFFTENQSGVNPHDELTEKDGLSPEEQSARIIINHVTEGVRLAEKYHLPRQLRDFITTHHGRGHVKYFYIQWKNNHPGQEPPEEAFTYPGPNPSTKEQAILMMCDAVEASSRSLKEYTEESITTLVNNIIDSQEREGYFRECDITYRDIADAKRVLIDSLKNIYHTRIAYPDLKTADASNASPLFTSLLGGLRKR